MPCIQILAQSLHVFLSGGMFVVTLFCFVAPLLAVLVGWVVRGRRCLPKCVSALAVYYFVVVVFIEMGPVFCLVVPLGPAVGGGLLILACREVPILAGHCQRCGYNLTGNTSGICPECGDCIQGQTLTDSVIGREGRTAWAWGICAALGVALAPVMISSDDLLLLGIWLVATVVLILVATRAAYRCVRRSRRPGEEQP